MTGSLWLIPAFLYYSFVPALTGGRTAGKWILRIRIGATATGDRPHWYQYPLRCGSLLLFLFALPRIFSLLPPLPAFLCYTVWFFFLAYTGIRAIRHRDLFYERLSGTRNISSLADQPCRSEEISS